MVTLLNFLAQILVHFSKTLVHQDHLVDFFSQCDLGNKKVSGFIISCLHWTLLRMGTLRLKTQEVDEKIVTA